MFTPRGRHTGEEQPLEVAPDRERPVLGNFAWPAALLIGWSGIALLWSEDRHQGAVYLLFYMLPLGLIAAAMARLTWRPGWVKVLYAELAVMAVVFALIGIWQYSTRTIYWNPKVKVDNVYAPVGWFYRVNSVFYDPSIYGRFLVVAILASVVLVLFEGSRWAWVAACVATVAVTGMIFSFSQSSFVSLAVGICVALTVLWRRKAIAPLAVAAAVLALVTLGVPQLRHRVLGKAGISHATGGRSSLVSNGLKIVEHHPLIGVGTGGFAEGYHRQTHRAGRASHTSPITVAAETGIAGLAFLLWLLFGGLTLPYKRNHGETELNRARLGFGLALLAVAVHSLFYNALIEDPLFWAALALTAVTWREVQRA
jgi:O-antigen ligase